MPEVLARPGLVARRPENEDDVARLLEVERHRGADVVDLPDRRDEQCRRHADLHTPPRRVVLHGVLAGDQGSAVGAARLVERAARAHELRELVLAVGCPLRAHRVRPAEIVEQRDAIEPRAGAHLAPHGLVDHRRRHGPGVDVRVARLNALGQHEAARRSVAREEHRRFRRDVAAHSDERLHDAQPLDLVVVMPGQGLPRAQVQARHHGLERRR